MGICIEILPGKSSLGERMRELAGQSSRSGSALTLRSILVVGATTSLGQVLLGERTHSLMRVPYRD